MMRFRLTPGVEESEFLLADRAVQEDFAYQQPGLLRRTTARADDDSWLVIDLWPVSYTHLDVYKRQAYGHLARAVYAPIYDLPGDLGRYDVAVFASILLHLRDPFRALEQAAAVTDDTIVVVEPLGVPAEDIDRPILFWNPTESANPNGWWLLTPGVITNMLAVLGFPNSTVTYHRQYFRPETAPGSEPVEATLFTVVARRD